ncbi:MAG: hypothetical protein WD024_03170 [Bacillota bacterium]
MAEEAIPLKVKFDDYLPVALGVRRASQIIVPAELPDASILGSTIDERFRHKMSGHRLPGESLQTYFKGKVGKYWRRNQAQEVRFRMDSLREMYSDVVENSHSYQTFTKWMDKLGLRRKELESRPTIREVYLYTDPSVPAELDELQDMRKDIRYERLRGPMGTTPLYSRAFPEELHTAYLKKLGSVLGFPLCCIDRYAFDRDSAVLSPEVRASNQLEHMENPDEYDAFAFYTKDFFPCQPDCASAAETGRLMYQKLAEISPEIAEKFRQHLDENVDLVRRYPEIIQKKIEALEKVVGHAQEGDKVEQ